MLTPQALQALMSALLPELRGAGRGRRATCCRSRSAPTVSPTDVMVTASGLLRAANLAVFELGMWQSWTGR